MQAWRPTALYLTGCLLLAGLQAGAEEPRCLLEQRLSSGAAACFTGTETVETVTAAPEEVLTLPDGTAVQPALGDYRVTTLQLELTEGGTAATVWETAARSTVAAAGLEPLARIVGFEEDAELLFVLYTRLGYFFVDVLGRGVDGAWQTVESLDTRVSESFAAGDWIEKASVGRDGEGYQIRCRFTRAGGQRWSYRPGAGLAALEPSDQPAASSRRE